MKEWFLILLFIIAVALVLFAFCRPATLEDVKHNSGSTWYVARNIYTGYDAFNGRIFRSEKAILRYIERKSKKYGLNASFFEIVKVTIF